MKLYTFNIVFFLVFSTGLSQQFTLKTSLNSIVNETSGLLYLNDTLITHNDSKNSNQLYDIDSDAQGLYRFDISTINVPNYNKLISFFPNPAQNNIAINQDECITQIFTMTGQLVATSIKT